MWTRVAVTRFLFTYMAVILCPKVYALNINKSVLQVHFSFYQECFLNTYDVKSTVLTIYVVTEFE